MSTFRCPSCGGLVRVDPARVEHAKCGRCKTRVDARNEPFHVGDDDLERVLFASPVPVLVDFYADWCGPCRMVAPVLEQLAAKEAGRLLVAKVDTEAHQRLAGRLGVQSIPALFLFKDGRVVDSITGARPYGAMQAWVAPHL